jgi:predicted nucleic acid-binding Zn ribbon protein
MRDVHKDAANSRHCRVCGEHHTNVARRFCDEHIPRCPCGQPAEPKRSVCVTCLNAERAAPPLARAKPCEVCGAEMVGPPSTIANRRTCSPTCRKALAAKTQQTRPCRVCGQPTAKGRSTCSDACIQEVAKQQVALIAKASEAKRAKRRRAKAASYRGKDKADVVSRLTREQRGRCKVCGGEGAERGDGKTGLVLDHCHETGVARALLCGPCNAALGLLGESPERIAALHRYALSWGQASLKVAV